MDDSTRGGALSQWDSYADQLRKQLPAAPEGLLNFYASVAPWLAIIFGILGIFVFVIAGFILALLSPFFMLGGASGVSSGLSAVVGLIFGGVGSVLSAIGGFQMLNRRLSGWRLLAFGIVLSAINDLLHLSLIGFIIILAVGWIHLQVKPRYS